jgi:hypothetical protein
MKQFIFFILGLIIISLTACNPSEIDEPSYIWQSQFEPVIMERADLEKSIKLIEPQTIKDFGKIYIKDSLLFVNEKYEGVHILDNSDPSNPENLGFIVIPGNIDISITNNIIYADNSVDLVAIKYNSNGVEVVDRNREVFPELNAPDGGNYSYNALNDRPENSVIVKWISK